MSSPFPPSLPFFPLPFSCPGPRGGFSELPFPQHLQFLCSHVLPLYPQRKILSLDESIIYIWITEGYLRKPHIHTDWHSHRVRVANLIQLDRCYHQLVYPLVSDSSLSHSSQCLVQIFTVLPTLLCLSSFTSPLTSLRKVRPY